MAIDTAQKRMGVFQVSGIMTPPFPNGSITAPDRQQMSDIYPGILAALPTSQNETCWIPLKEKESTWINSKKITNIWVREKSETKIWIPEQEVVPCDD